MTQTQGQQGRVLAGRYRLVRMLGHGGMATVWLARDDMLGRDVAVKEVVPPAELPAEERRRLRERALREARAAARINNPFAVTVYDVIEEDHRPWIVMQLLDARSLGDVLKEDGPIAPRRAAQIGLCLVDALRAAHDAGVLHRDVKPANVMLTEYGRAVLTDFGIATVEGDPTLTTGGVVIGSPAYMAPERARGHPLTPASDLWSLGATLFAAVEGRSPFQRDGQLATLTAIVNEAAPDAPRAGALAPVIAQLLSKDPAERPSAAETRIMLQEAALAEHEPTQPRRTAVVPAPAPPSPVEAPPPAPVEEGPPSRRRPWALAMLAAAVVLAVVAGAALLMPDQPRGTPQAKSPAAVSPSPSPGQPRATTATTPTASPPATATTGQAGGSGPGSSGQGSGSSGQGSGGSQGSAAIPAGFRLFRDPSGFRIAIPNGWTRSRTDTRTYFRDPAGGRYLMVDQTTDPKPDALADWRQQESGVAQRLSGYQRIRLERVSYRGWNAADWEFTWQPGGGRLHVLNRNIRVNDQRAYALYWSTRETQWQQSRRYFDTFARTFQPAG